MCQGQQATAHPALQAVLCAPCRAREAASGRARGRAVPRAAGAARGIPGRLAAAEAGAPAGGRGAAAALPGAGPDRRARLRRPRQAAPAAAALRGGAAVVRRGHHGHRRARAPRRPARRRLTCRGVTGQRPWSAGTASCLAPRLPTQAALRTRAGLRVQNATRGAPARVSAPQVTSVRAGAEGQNEHIWQAWATLEVREGNIAQARKVRACRPLPARRPRLHARAAGQQAGAPRAAL